MKVKKFKHLSFEDRCVIEEFLNHGFNMFVMNVKSLIHVEKFTILILMIFLITNTSKI